MDTTAFAFRLSERRMQSLSSIIEKLETAIAAGVVPNTLLTDAKFIINRAVDEAFDHYQKETQDYGGKLIMGAHDLPSGIKQATTDARRKVLNDLLPLHTLLQQAKPLIAKRGDARLAPKPKSAKQIADEANQMTCQCCGRGIFAATGLIAHHGYERPGYGWQTASCVGARELPFEVSRDRLGQMIDSLTAQHKNMTKWRKAVATESAPITIRFSYYSRRNRRTESAIVSIDRAGYAAGQAHGYFNPHRSFDDYKSIDLAGRDSEIRHIAHFIKEQQARYDGWKQTHRWNAEKKIWEPV